MNWLKTLWNKLVSKTSVAPTLVVVEEVQDLSELLVQAFEDTGVSEAYTCENLVARYEDWYEGEHDAEAVADSLKDFRDSLPPGMQRKIKVMQRSSK